MRYDVIIIGGSFAGLSAALHLVRARRSMLLIDAGQPRNRFATSAHGLFGHDGSRPGDLLASGREQVSAYPTATVVSGEAVGVEPDEDGFAVTLADGVRYDGRRVLLATGIVDIMPEIRGLAERWGRTVLHCPYCHAYEIGGGSIGVLATDEASVKQASLVAEWGDVTFFTNGAMNLDASDEELLTRRCVAVETGEIASLEGSAPALDGIRLRDGRLIPIRALFINAATQMASPLAETIGCAFEDGGSGPQITTDSAKMTTIEGVYAAGDAAYGSHNITCAAADGITAALGIHHALIAEDAVVSDGANLLLPFLQRAKSG